MATRTRRSLRARADARCRRYSTSLVSYLVVFSNILTLQEVVHDDEDDDDDNMIIERKV